MTDQSSLMEILSLQETRARAFAKLNAGYKEMLETKNTVEFNNVVAQVTVEFKACSDRIRMIEEQFKEQKNLSKAHLLRSLQEEEKKHLRLTLTLHKLRQAFSYKVFSWQQLDSDDKDILEPPQRKRCDGCCSHSEGEHSHTPLEPLEPTELEFTSALREADLSLNSVIIRINEIIDEIRQLIDP